MEQLGDLADRVVLLEQPQGLDDFEKAEVLELLGPEHFGFESLLGRFSNPKIFDDPHGFFWFVIRYPDSVIGMNTKKVLNRQARIEKIKKQLKELGEILPGSLSQQYNVCGKPHCRCKDPDHPKKHGPYYHLSYTWKAQGKTIFVRSDQVKQTKHQIKNYRTLKLLIQQWVDLSLDIAQLRKQR